MRHFCSGAAAQVAREGAPSTNSRGTGEADTPQDLFGSEESTEQLPKPGVVEEQILATALL